MKDSLGAPIEWEPSTQTYFYTRRCDLLPLLRLDADEAMALVLASRAFSAWGGSSLGRALTAALKKIAGVVGGAVSLPVSELGELVSNPEDSAELDGEGRFIADAIEAIRRRRECVLLYRKPGSRRAEHRTVHPLHLALLDHRWTLVVHDLARGEPRKFLLARMQELAPTGKVFEPHTEFDADAYLAGSFGLFTGKADYDVRVCFDRFAAPFIRERRWHPSQQVLDLPEGEIEVRLRLNNLIDVQRWLLAWGSHAEAMAPAELRESVAEEIRTLFTRYAVSPHFSEARDTR